MRSERYLITCPAGLEALLADSILRADPGAVVDTKLSGLVAFRASMPEADIVGHRCASNAFLILGERGFPAGGRGGRLPDASASLLKALSSGNALRGARGAPGSGFRVMLSSENELVPPDRGVLARAEAAIALETGMRPARAGADTEFWLILRSEGRAYFCQRLSRRRATEKDLAKGELKPEIAYALCVAAGVEDGSRVLDPFCGSGAIPLECLDAFPRARVTAGDKDPAKARRLDDRARAGSRLAAVSADFLEPESYPAGAFDAIVTDPPWGDFESLDDPAAFYAAFLRACSRALAEGGRLAFLSGAKGACEAAFRVEGSREGAGKIVLRERYDILVSGRKAALWSCVKA